MRVALITDELQKRDAAAPELEEQYFVFVSMVEELLLCFVSAHRLGWGANSCARGLARAPATFALRSNVSGGGVLGF